MPEPILFRAPEPTVRGTRVLVLDDGVFRVTIDCEASAYTAICEAEHAIGGDPRYRLGVLAYRAFERVYSSMRRPRRRSASSRSSI